MRNEIKTKVVKLPSDIGSFINITMNNSHKIKPFMKKFWEQRMFAFSKKNV